jgi:hypothetical protein
MNTTERYHECAERIPNVFNAIFDPQDSPPCAATYSRSPSQDLE